MTERNIQLWYQLNPAQYAAVTTLDGPVLVIAGAGTGKTRVIEYRVLNLVQSGISPNSILLLTFTRKAAKTMLDRASRHDPRCKDVEGGTFHSFAYKILKRYSRLIGLDSFLVLDEADSEEAIHKCCTLLGFFDKEKRFPKKDTLRAIMSMAVNRGVKIEEVLKKDYGHFLEYARDIEELRKKYTEYKITRNYVDYDDLLIYLKILLENKKLRERLSEKYRYIMVDEYQDTNIIQADISYLLAEKHRNIMVVGDDAQSIYGFRGASHENMMTFPKRFPECKIIKLEENYRSTQSILDLANAVLDNMTNKYSKCLVSARKVSGQKPVFYHFKDSYEEAEWVAERIKTLHDEGIPFSHQAVLFRSSYLSIPLEVALSKRNIPYQVFGGLKFYETAHVKDVISHLKVILNPKDELAWNRVLMLIEGIGPRTADKIFGEIGALSDLGSVLNEVFPRYTSLKKFSEGLRRLEEALKKALDNSLRVAEKYSIICEYYEPILKDRYDDWNLRLNDLEVLGQIAERYETVDDFLTDFAIEPPEKGISAIDPSTPEEERPLTLSTIHSAKGLEWEAVFIVGLADGILPVSFSLSSQEETEEEHRLFYVAITRAKNHLFLSMHHEGTKGGINRFNKVSRFLDTPNVLSRLETEPPYSFEHKEDKKPEALEQIYDKKSLIDKVTRFFK
ncbi:MAG: ATP-dependent helicase [Deltaproteobacteria bacterium]|nr:ATP-dependent helicase [Deltaproteobacteria bacterium]